jgi:YggT family protein
MGVLGFVSLALFLLQLLLIARAVLDWSVALAGPSTSGSLRYRLTRGVRGLTEPILAPVRRVSPPRPVRLYRPFACIARSPVSPPSPGRPVDVKPPLVGRRCGQSTGIYVGRWDHVRAVMRALPR